MELKPFRIARLPQILFGRGELDQVAGLIAAYGRTVLLVTGANSFRQSDRYETLCKQLADNQLQVKSVTVSGEPSPTLVDEAVQSCRDAGIDVVLAVGGGSVVDAAKAMAALLPTGDSVLEHLEDVGKGIPYTGTPLPMIAVPTTAGTGSEATKNAVLSQHGEGGYKKSFRDDAMVPDIAVIDPSLMDDMPRHLVAAQGMDAFTQLLESYVSRRANPFTDALAWSGLQAVKEGFVTALDGDGEGRAKMAYGALLSGITLAQVGLGAVHGLAQPFGSLFPIPHGVACGTVLAAATEINIQALHERDPNHPSLEKYARVGRLLSDHPDLDDDSALAQLVEVLEGWIDYADIPRLGHFNITEANISEIVAHSRGNSMKSNPIDLSDEEVAAIVRKRL